MAYNIKIEVFEGPFDILFNLIEKNKIDIYDIPMTQITEQYISYLEKLEELNLEITSEFLVLAATLIEIKSKMLLPMQITEDTQLGFEELDPREELVRRLLDYKKYKAAAGELKDKEQRYQRIFFKQREEFILDETHKTEVILDSIEKEDLLIALSKVFKKHKEKTPYGKMIREMHRDAITIEDKIDELKVLLRVKKKILFQELFSNISLRLEIITTFLALLELIRLGQVVVSQSNAYSRIIIEVKDTDELRGDN